VAYFTIPAIKSAIEHLQAYRGNWLIPAFVFAANDVGTDGLVDMSQRLGTDQFLDRYFNGKRVDIPPFPSGNNLLRPRLRDITWNRGRFAGDHMIRQDTKLWGNLFSSRGYREMRLEGLIDGEKAIVKLTDAFQPRFEAEIPAEFRFENLLVWLFAFEGFPDDVSSWAGLFAHFLDHELGLQSFQPAYQTRFRLVEPPLPWPETLTERPSNQEFLSALAPKLLAFLTTGGVEDAQSDSDVLPSLKPDDPFVAEIEGAINRGESYSFLLAGPPGTGKTRYARQLANHLAGDNSDQLLFLQFHPTMGYDDFIEGFRPATSDEGAVRYKLEPRLFLEFARRAAKNPSAKFVAVIDELNRGDVARIFGEMLTYLEPDYRGQEFTLSYSGENGSLPRNLILIATANPYDRSVTDLDDALLRRFWVIELQPDGMFLRLHLQDRGVENGVINRALQMFEILNRLMPAGFGHTCFLKIESVEDLGAVWSGRIRLALHRALVHDRTQYDAACAEIEALLTTREADDDGPAEAGAEEPQ
jgi:5-methylcytosine-specific restriction protein B